MDKSRRRQMASILAVLMMTAAFFIISAVSVSAHSIPDVTGVINYNGSLNVRTSASTSSKIVMKIKGGTKVVIIEEQFTSKSSYAQKNKWYKIKYNGKTGYVKANRVKSIKYGQIKGKLSARSNYRYGPGTGMKKKGAYSRNQELTIVCRAKAKGSSKTWYKIKVGSKYYYIANTSVKLIDNKPKTAASAAPANTNPYANTTFEKFISDQGFPESYKVKLRELHKKHPNWVFIAKKTNIDFQKAVDKECSDGVSLIHSSYPLSYRDKGPNSYRAGTSLKMSSAPPVIPETAAIPEQVLESDTDAVTPDDMEIKTGDPTAEDTVPVEENAIPEDTVSKEVADESKTDADGSSGTPEPSETAEPSDVPDETAEVSGEPDGSAEMEGAVVTDDPDADQPADVVPETEPAAEPVDENVQQDTADQEETETVQAEIKPLEVTEAPLVKSEEKLTLEKPVIEAPAKSGVKLAAAGTYIPKDGSSWYNADKTVVSYYMDPRNFLNEERIYMFEDLSYQQYHTAATVQKIIMGTALSKDGYLPAWFVNAGKKYSISPISLAVRARSEVGGGSIACSGYKIDGVTYYNPFNIGAVSGSNPVLKGMQYARDKGWNTKEKAINGGASLLAGSYLKNNQNTLYFQRFNVANGLSKVATNQYMTNIMAPYSESVSTYSAYKGIGILNEQLVFVIPVYTNLPDKTSLPS